MGDESRSILSVHFKVFAMASIPSLLPDVPSFRLYPVAIALGTMSCTPVGWHGFTIIAKKNSQNNHDPRLEFWRALGINMLKVDFNPNNHDN